jgi:subtilase family serine protease
MRKTTTLVLILVVLLALAGSALAVFAKAPASRHKTPPSTARGATSVTPVFRTLWMRDRSKKNGFAPNAANVEGFTPQQLRKAYGISQLRSKGDGITIAIVDAFGNPNAQADLNRYSATFGLPTTQIKVVFPQGEPATIDPGWAMETNLDIQMAHAMAPNAQIVLVAAKSPSLADMMGAIRHAYVNQGADIVSMSFGGGEFAAQTGANADGIFQAGVLRGVSFTASSGDNGTGASYPAASPFVTAVGGTTLRTQADGTYIRETAWSGSGGGLSQFATRPAYQNGFNANARRGLPDVAMVADPETGVAVYNSFGIDGQKGFFSVGGTSVGAPLFAGFLALVNQNRKQAIQNPNPELYTVARTRFAADFHDIKQGSNGNCGALCRARTGYDFVNGLGSPISNRLIFDLIKA